MGGGGGGGGGGGSEGKDNGSLETKTAPGTLTTSSSNDVNEAATRTLLGLHGCAHQVLLFLKHIRSISFERVVLDNGAGTGAGRGGNSGSTAPPTGSVTQVLFAISLDSTGDNRAFLAARTDILDRMLYGSKASAMLGDKLSVADYQQNLRDLADARDGPPMTMTHVHVTSRSRGRLLEAVMTEAGGGDGLVGGREEEAVVQSAEWVLCTRMADAEAVDIACADEHALSNRRIPMVQVAACVRAGDDWVPPIDGFMHCFLPLAEEVGHRVHCNLFAQVTTDRRRLRRSEHDTVERRWAFAQVEHGIAPAYAELLAHLAEASASRATTQGGGQGGTPGGGKEDCDYRALLLPSSVGGGGDRGGKVGRGAASASSLSQLEQLYGIFPPCGSHRAADDLHELLVLHVYRRLYDKSVLEPRFESPLSDHRSGPTVCPSDKLVYFPSSMGSSIGGSMGGTERSTKRDGGGGEGGEAGGDAAMLETLGEFVELVRTSGLYTIVAPTESLVYGFERAGRPFPPISPQILSEVRLFVFVGFFLVCWFRTPASVLGARLDE